MTFHRPPSFQAGQAFVTLLLVVAAGMVVLGVVVSLTISSTQSLSQYAKGQQAYFLAEAGMEHALLRLLRDPAYSGGTLTLSEGTATIEVNGTHPTQLKVTAQSGGVQRQVEAVVEFESGEMTVSSWREQF